MMKAKVPINDDQGLEKEADVMGAKALQMKPFSLSDYSAGKSVQKKGIVQKVDVPMGNLLGEYDSGAQKNEAEHIPARAPEKSGEDTTATVGPFT
jgi:hypothetical protein